MIRSSSALCPARQENKNEADIICREIDSTGDIFDFRFTVCIVGCLVSTLEVSLPTGADDSFRR